MLIKCIFHRRIILSSKQWANNLIQIPHIAKQKVVGQVCSDIGGVRIYMVVQTGLTVVIHVSGICTFLDLLLCHIQTH